MYKKYETAVLLTYVASQEKRGVLCSSHIGKVGAPVAAQSGLSNLVQGIPHI